MPEHINTSQVLYGKRILPVKRIEILSAEEWEVLTEEWLDLKKSKYHDIERIGGAGDKGLDVIAYKEDKATPNFNWDCYQCKHYNTALTPSQVYVEFGKILFYTFIKEYTTPDNYYFVAPKGCGTTLSRLLNNPKELKKNVKKNWSKYCEKQIINSNVKLTGKLLKHVNQFDFSIFNKVLPKTLVAEHKLHPNHLTWFGGSLPSRKKLNEGDIPSEIQNNEINYVAQIIKVYSSDSAKKYKSPKDFKNDIRYSHHFKRSRINFHYAEQLRNFSRDSLPVGTFEDFQDEIHSGIIDVVEDGNLDAFKKVKDSEEKARNLIISSNPLKEVSIVNDRSGVCHQLVNNKRIKWI